MIQRTDLSRILAGFALICSITMCGCAALSRQSRKANVAPAPAPPRETGLDSEVVSASFETVCPADRRTPGGYLRQGPTFSAVDGVGNPHAAVAQLRHLTAENERLEAENADVRKTLGELQDDLIQARRSLMLSEEGCRAARSELIATRKQLSDWQREMETALAEFQIAEQRHLGELESAIETVRTVVDEQRNEKGDSPTVDARLSDNGNGPRWLRTQHQTPLPRR